MHHFYLYFRSAFISLPTVCSVSVCVWAEEVEEVFAEDYDDATFVPSAETNQPELAETDIPPAGVEPEITASEDDGRELIHEIVACPNKVNCYHECGVYCAERWGLKAFELVPGLQYKQQRLLRKYPLPDGWREVGDPTTWVFVTPPREYLWPHDMSVYHPTTWVFVTPLRHYVIICDGTTWVFVTPLR